MMANYGNIRIRCDRGFTLVELLVAMAVSGIIMAAVGTIFYSQQKSYVAQEQIAAMQQGLRSGKYLLEREIQMAGYDPYGNSGAGITAAAQNSITFTMVADDDSVDNDNDGSTDETGELQTIIYFLYDSDGDGDNDLGRNVDAGGNQGLVENVDALDFVYLDENSTPTGTVSEIRSVQISLVAKSGRADQGYVNSSSYSNQQGTTILAAQNDNFHRKLLTAEVKFRNLGL